jgi:type I restriction enzyme R subunit
VRIIKKGRFSTFYEGINVLLENNVTLTTTTFNDLGENFEKTTNGYIDHLLLDAQGFPFIVLEAKSEDKNFPIAQV